MDLVQWNIRIKWKNYPHMAFLAMFKCKVYSVEGEIIFQKNENFTLVLPWNKKKIRML